MFSFPILLETFYLVRLYLLKSYVKKCSLHVYCPSSSMATIPETNLSIELHNKKKNGVSQFLPFALESTLNHGIYEKDKSFCELSWAFFLFMEQRMKKTLGNLDKQ